MASRISVCALAAGLGLVGGAVILETLSTASSGPSGRVRPTEARSSGPRPSTEIACLPDVPESVPPPEEEGKSTAPENGDSGSAGPEAPARVRPTLSGIVLDPDGIPVPGASLVGPLRKCHCDSLAPRVEPVGADGRFEWTPDWIRSPDCFEFIVRAKGFATAHFAMSAAEAELLEGSGALEGVEIRPRREAILMGVVFGPDGAPRAGASVVLTLDPVIRMTDSRISKSNWEVESDEQGRYRFDGLDSKWPLWVQAQDAGFLFSHREYAFEVLREGEIGRVDLALRESKEVEIAIRVVGVDPGWILDLDGKQHTGESALLMVPWRTGRFSYYLTDAEGLRLASGWREIPHEATEYEVDFDFSDRRPGEEVPWGPEPEDPPPPDTGE